MRQHDRLAGIESTTMTINSAPISFRSGQNQSNIDAIEPSDMIEGAW